MTKKDFKTGLNTLLGETAPAAPQPTEERQSRKEITKTTQEGTYEGESRHTFIINEAKLEKLKALAYWERITQKDLIDQAIDMLLKSKDPELLEKAVAEFNKSNTKAK
jgi:hypothetical protein